MRYYLSLLLALGLFCVAAAVCTAPAFAQDIKPMEPQQQPTKGTEKPAPTKTTRRGTPVTVQHEGDDELGARLALKLKETLNNSSLFDVSDKDEKKLKVIVKTLREFEGRPNSSSIYSLVWVYSESEATLKYFLDSQIGLINEGELQSTAEGIAAATEKVGARYSYLFE